MLVKKRILVIIAAANLLSACAEQTPDGESGQSMSLSNGPAQASAPSAQTSAPPPTQVGNAPVVTQPPVVVQPTPPIQPSATDRLRMQAIGVISGYYRLYLGREPEKAGLDYYVDLALQGVSLSVIQNSIASSPEAQARNQSVAREAATQTITGYYRLFLAREPDGTGLEFWVMQSLQGYPMSKIMNDIANSNEAKIRGSYLRHLRREPDAAGLSYFMNQAGGGRSLADIDNEIRFSPESQIRQMYKLYLRREPDAAGLVYWVNQVSFGQSIAQVDSNIRNSPEALALR
jgi:hypothetical protein